MEFQTIDGKVKRVKNLKKRIINWEASSRSKRQKAVKDFLKDYWYNHVTFEEFPVVGTCLLYTSPSPRDRQKSRMPSSA